MEKIVDFLVNGSANSEDLSVYPIVGLGGLGKTTLAQLIFNHDKVVNHFALRSWVCVSEDFSVMRMTKSIIESISGGACENLELEPLQRKLRDLLFRKRYLLVLDDVWDDDQENWQKLKTVLACGGKGATVLVTTRLLKVATIVGTMPPYELQRLSYHDCWELFKQRAFETNEEDHLIKLVVIGKEIVEKCAGVPLATIALGSLLRFKRDENEWLYIKESKLWSLPGANSVMSALRLSYLNLPVKVRQCFSICALFPKDEIIDKQFLIELWVANGFISSNEMLESEDIGNEVWNELYWRSFFQDITTDDYGNIMNFKMHDLVHDLAQSVAEDVYCITKDNDTPRSKTVSHISSNQWKAFEAVIFLSNTKSLKTYIQQEDDINDKLPANILECYSLRVLKFEGIKKLSPSIGHLRYLRYLNLSHSAFKTLPESLCELWNLQILKLEGCFNLQTLPDNLVHLKSLQHIYLNGCYSLSSLPSYMRKLTSLRTLSMYIVGKRRGSFLEELGQLNLKGELHIKHLERVKSVTDSKEANMSRKYLNHLWLSWERNNESQLQENVEQIAENLQPHTPQLQSLGVGGYRGEHFPKWMSSPSLQDLKLLVLEDCEKCLYIKEEASGDRTVGGFISLEKLWIVNMPKLMSLSREDGENLFTRLSKLTIIECPNLSALPFLPALKKLRVKGKCRWEFLSSIYKLHNLESLILEDNEEVTCFPDDMLSNLTSLKQLKIWNHSKLKLLPIQTINPCTLKILYINSCQSLESLKDETLQRLHSLEKLVIFGCPNFNLSSGFRYLTCLEKLAISNFSNMSGFEEALQHMTALQSLMLEDLPDLSSLPDCLGNLSLLHTLLINSCSNLICLPTTIQCLSGLKELGICGCPELAKRCLKETGEDWQKIAHVQYLTINDNFSRRYRNLEDYSFLVNGGIIYSRFINEGFV